MPPAPVRPFSTQRPLVCVAIAYGLGILAAGCMTYRPLYGATGLILSIVFLIVCRSRRVYALSAALFCVGLLYAGALLTPRTPPKGAYHVTAYVSGEARLTASGRRAVMLEDVLLANENGEQYNVSKLYWSFAPQDDEEEFPLIDGRQIAFSGRLYAPSPQMNPYGFDYRLYLLTQGVASGLSGAKDLGETGESRVTFAGVMLRARQAIERHIERLFGDSAALPKALLLGVRDELPQDVIEAFKESGITHVLAVSGLHVGLLAALLAALLKLLKAPHGARLIVMSIFLFLYCALLHFSAPVLRAAILCMTTLWGKYRRRRRDGLTLLSAAFFLILLLRPLDLFSAGFQLSFIAVLGISLLRRPLWRLLRFIRFRRIRAALTVTFSAVLATALPVAELFHRLSVVGLIVSPLVCALLMPLLLLYVLALILGAVWLPIGEILAIPAIWLTDLLTSLAEAGAGTNPAAFNVPSPNALWFLLALMLALSISGYLLWKKGVKIAACLSLAVAALVVGAIKLPREVAYIQFSVGQEDAALLIDGRETVLIDCSGSGGDVADYLLSSGLSADTVILTHLHADHCMGLSDLIKAKVPVGRVLLPEGADRQLADAECLQLLGEIAEAGIPLIRVSAGDTVQTARARLVVLFPDKDKQRTGVDANLYAAALLLTVGQTRMLIMSDTDGMYENYVAVPADILKVAHHGSAGATGENFLAAVSPSVALVSCGAGNDVLPSPDLIERLDQSVPSWYRTDKDGALILSFGEGGVRVAPFRRRLP